MSPQSFVHHLPAFTSKVYLFTSSSSQRLLILWRLLSRLLSRPLSMESLECTMDITHYILRTMARPTYGVYGVRSTYYLICRLPSWIHHFKLGSTTGITPCGQKGRLCCSLPRGYYVVTTPLLRRSYRWLHRAPFVSFYVSAARLDNPDRSGGVLSLHASLKVFLHYGVCTLHSPYMVRYTQQSCSVRTLRETRLLHQVRLQTKDMLAKECLRKTCHESVCPVLCSVQCLVSTVSSQNMWEIQEIHRNTRYIKSVRPSSTIKDYMLKTDQKLIIAPLGSIFISESVGNRLCLVFSHWSGQILSDTVRY